MLLFDRFKWLALLLALVLSSAFIKAEGLEKISSDLDSLMAIEAVDEALIVAKKLEKLSKKQDQKGLLAKAYANLAKLYYAKKSYNKSINYFEKELNLRTKEAEPSQLAEAYYNLGSTCVKLKKNRKARAYFENSLSYSEKLEDEGLKIACYQALIVVNEALYDHKKASAYLKELLNYHLGSFDQKIELYKKEVVTQKRIVKQKSTQLNTTRKILGKTKQVLDTAKVELKASEQTIQILEEDTLRKQQKIASLNFQKLLKEYELKAKQDELDLEKKLSNILITGIALVSVLALFVFFLMLSKKRLNRRLKEQNVQIESQNKSIRHSIEYASKIQQASLPDHTYFETCFDDYFVWYQPRDIVSGDFYFLQKVNEYIVFAAVDCTGHGVPGAFMSMLGVAALNDIIRQSEVTKASQILELLREQVKTSLKQKGEKGGQRDGMDMAVGVININNLQMQFAGAHNPLVIIRSGELIEYKGDRMPVGIHRKEKPFTNHLIDLEKGDQLYLFSDGFADQVGGEQGKTYKSKAFKALLLRNSNLPMLEQKLAIIAEYQNWRSDYKAIDDIVILGLKV